MRILVLYYSQSGDVTRSVTALVEPLAATGATIVWENLRPKTAYPSPWRSMTRFFSVMPDCILGDAPEIEDPRFDASEPFDLVILAYQVWFLSPSLPIRRFLESRHAAVLRDRKVITISVSRNMWHSASLTMKQLLAAAGGRQIDNIVVTHQGPAWATFITTTRALLLGKRDKLWGIFPPAGLGAEQFDRLARLGACVASQLPSLATSGSGSLLRGQGAVELNRSYVLPELVGWYVFSIWARVLRFLKGRAPWAHSLGIYGFMLFLLASIVFVVPLLMVGRWLLNPILKRRIADYIAQLEAPSGS